MKRMGYVVLLLMTTAACLSASAYGAENDPASSGSAETLQGSLKQPLAHLPAVRYEFAPVIEGQEVTHDFVIQNKGSAPLEIQKVKTD